MPRIHPHDDPVEPPARASARPDLSFWAAAAVRVAARPRLWLTALRQARRLARPRWWARAPFVPVPDADYLRFRFETQYGAGAPSSRDLVAYLEWCRAMDRVLGHRND
ncbi:MAG TPA: hypothetical protein VHS03_12580 [Gaiellaceae bacterium]|nr:hypothetical protein [Gaiellaceae bacterium]